MTESLNQAGQPAPTDPGQGQGLFDRLRQNPVANLLMLGGSVLALAGTAKEASGLLDPSPAAAVTCDPGNPNVSTTKCTPPRNVLLTLCSEDFHSRLSEPLDSRNEPGIDQADANGVSPVSGLAEFRVSFKEGLMRMCGSAGTRRISVVETIRYGESGSFKPDSNVVTKKSDKVTKVKAPLTLKSAVDCSAPGMAGTAVEPRVTNKWKPRKGYPKLHGKNTVVYHGQPVDIC